MTPEPSETPPPVGASCTCPMYMRTVSSFTCPAHGLVVNGEPVVAVAPQSVEQARTVETYSGPVTVERISRDSSGSWFNATLLTGGGWSERVSNEVEQAIAATAVEPYINALTQIAGVLHYGRDLSNRVKHARKIAEDALASPPPSSAPK